VAGFAPFAVNVQPLGADPPPVFELQVNACELLSQVQLLPLMVIVAARAGAAAKARASTVLANMTLAARISDRIIIKSLSPHVQKTRSDDRKICANDKNQ